MEHLWTISSTKIALSHIDLRCVFFQTVIFRSFQKNLTSKVWYDSENDIFVGNKGIKVKSFLQVKASK